MKPNQAELSSKARFQVAWETLEMLRLLAMKLKCIEAILALAPCPSLESSPLAANCDILAASNRWLYLIELM